MLWGVSLSAAVIFMCLGMFGVVLAAAGLATIGGVFVMGQDRIHV